LSAKKLDESFELFKDSARLSLNWSGEGDSVIPDPFFPNGQVAIPIHSRNCQNSVVLSKARESAYSGRR
jgi:hypothetical protein